MPDWITCASRGSSGRDGSAAPASQVVVWPPVCRPSRASASWKPGNIAITPMEPVMVDGSAITSSLAVAIQ